MPNKFNRLIEPFAGSAAISLACASNRKSEKYILNDLNKPLIELLKIVIETPKFASEKYRQIWSNQAYDSIEHYYQVREKFNLTKDPLLFLYLMARCVKGSVRYNADGFFNQSPDKRRRGTNPSTMEKNIYEVSYLLKGKSEFYTFDYKSILDLARPGDIVYMDPPYQGVCGDHDSRYFSGINHNEFIGILQKLTDQKISFIVSYDGSCGNKTYGEEIPESLDVEHIQLCAGRSSQSTLLGKNEITYESLYVSNDLFKSSKKFERGFCENELFARVS
jgi:DNA adenine methylase